MIHGAPTTTTLMRHTIFDTGVEQLVAVSHFDTAPPRMLRRELDRVRREFAFRDNDAVTAHTAHIPGSGRALVVETPYGVSIYFAETA